MSAPIYRGFSSVANTGIDTRLYDLDLIMQDLSNQFNTRLGERVGRPTFGSIIWDLMFDPSDDRTESLVIQDAKRIVAGDPRVELLDIITDISLETHKINLSIKLKAVEFDMNDWFTITFSHSD